MLENYARNLKVTSRIRDINYFIPTINNVFDDLYKFYLTYGHYWIVKGILKTLLDFALEVS